MNFTLTITATPELLNTLDLIASALGAKASVNQISATEGLPAGINQAPAAANIAPVQQPIQQIPQKAQPMHMVTPVIPTQQIQQPAASAVPTQAPVQQPVQTAPGAIPTAGQSYTMDQLAVAATKLVDAGRRTDLVNLLSGFGVQALTALPKEQYGAFATQLRAMGARI